MALLDQGWIIFIACCCILGISLWTGVNAMTVKLMFLWTFIAFGFLTLILHVSGSSVIKLLSRLKSAVLQPEASVHSEEDLVQRRQRATKKKQVLQDDRTQFFQETVLQPRKDAELDRKNADFYRFGKLWRGPGYKLKSEDLPESADGENEIDANSYSKVFGEEVSGDTLSTEDLRHRKSDKHKQTKMDDYYQQVAKSLPTEPPIGSVGVITVALRCPNGKVNKRRFTLESQIQGLVTFAAYLGFPPSQYIILKTYPRESLSNVTQTFQEAGLTHDVAQRVKFCVEEHNIRGVYMKCCLFSIPVNVAELVQLWQYSRPIRSNSQNPIALFHLIIDIRLAKFSILYDISLSSEQATVLKPSSLNCMITMMRNGDVLLTLPDA